MPDYLVTNHGSLFLVEPQSDNAKQNLEDNTDDEAQWFHRSLVVEHRYARELVAQLQAEGWVVE